MQIGFTYVSPGNTDTKTLPECPPDATGSTLGNRCSWEGDGTVQERHHLCGAHQEIGLALDLEGKEENRVFPVWSPTQRQLLSPC